MHCDQGTSFRTCGIAFTACALLAACGVEREGGSTLGPAEQAADQPASAMVQAELGVTQLPRPRDHAAFTESLRRHYPAEFRAEWRTGAVLLDVTIDPQGSVRGVEVVPTAAGEPDGTHRAVLLDRDPATGRTVERPLQPKYDAAFGPAARAALREVRFTPALRDGQPVTHTLRMTVEFAPPLD
jgi:outer membrane biosynthesis protein TonB